MFYTAGIPAERIRLKLYTQSYKHTSKLHINLMVYTNVLVKCTVKMISLFIYAFGTLPLAWIICFTSLYLSNIIDSLLFVCKIYCSAASALALVLIGHMLQTPPLFCVMFWLDQEILEHLDNHLYLTRLQ